MSPRWKGHEEIESVLAAVQALDDVSRRADDLVARARLQRRALEDSENVPFWVTIELFLDHTDELVVDISTEQTRLDKGFVLVRALTPNMARLRQTYSVGETYTIFGDDRPIRVVEAPPADHSWLETEPVQARWQQPPRPPRTVMEPVSRKEYHHARHVGFVLAGILIFTAAILTGATGHSDLSAVVAVVAGVWGYLGAKERNHMRQVRAAVLPAPTPPKELDDYR